MFSNSSKYSIFFTLPLLGYVGYTFYNHLTSIFYMSYVDLVDFYIHEFGHIFFGTIGFEFLGVAGGTILQLLIPFLLLIYFRKNYDYFAVALCYFWLGTNFFYISTYAGDAVKMKLPLISMGSGEAIHDWFYMFTKLGLIGYTDLISNTFFYTAIVFYVICFVYSLALIINRFRGGNL